MADMAKCSNHRPRSTLMLDDWGLSLLNPPERRDHLEMLDDRQRLHHPHQPGPCRTLARNYRLPNPRPRTWIASFTTFTTSNSPEKACVSRTPAIKLSTPTQTPEPINQDAQSRCSPRGETAAHDEPEIVAYYQRNRHYCRNKLQPSNFYRLEVASTAPTTEISAQQSTATSCSPKP